MAVPTGLEPAIPRVTGECDNHYTTEPMVAGAGFEPTTFGLWAQRATRLLYPAITIFHRFFNFWWLFKWRRKRDSNPCADFSTSRFSRPVPSTRLGYSSLFKWCLRSDLNRYELLHSQDFKSCASTYSATEAQYMVSRWGFEPQTPWLKVKCSTGWASETYNKFGCLGWIRTSGMQESKSCALPLGYEAKLQVVERGGFEPPNPKEQIYSLPRLASSLSLHMVPKTGIEPVTYWLQVSCSTNWAISANHGGRWETRTPDPLLVRQML